VLSSADVAACTLPVYYVGQHHMAQALGLAGG
jgi:hypothetical protein